ncbi:MAG: flagellar brake protein [Clostridium sp.]|jgi:c-di-GMP-binding flagellar brake protein YcgR|nr:flagellar brake protein [Clostridium sp.]
MISKFIRPGDKVELSIDHQAPEGRQHQRTKTYKSAVYGILTEEEVSLELPMVGSKYLIPPVGTRLNLVFLASVSPFQCLAKVKRVYKENGSYFMLVELTGSLRKQQRREYYRFGCTLDMVSKVLSEEERTALGARPVKGDLEPGVIADISGGGLRFVTSKSYDEGSCIYCGYSLRLGEEDVHRYELAGEVLEVREIEDKKDLFEHRVRFVDLDDSTRKELVKDLFELERRNRSHQSWKK